MDGGAVAPLRRIPGDRLSGLLRTRATPDDLAASGRTLRRPVVRGLVVGRTLLYPPDGDVWSAVDAAARLLRSAAEERD